MKLTPALVDDITNLSFSCSGLGMGVAATALGASGGVLVGAAAALGVIGFKALAKNCKAVPNSPRQLRRIQKSLQEKWAIIARDHPDDMAVFDRCQKPLREVLSFVSIEPKKLSDLVRNPDQLDFPSSATHYVLSRIEQADPRFASGIGRRFAAAVVQAGFEAAIEDRRYFEALEPHLLLGVARDVAETKRNTEEILARLDAARGGMTDKTRNRAIRILNDEKTDDMSNDEIVVEVLNRLIAHEKAQDLAEAETNLGDEFADLAKTVDDLLDADDGAEKALARLDEAIQSQRDNKNHIEAVQDKTFELAIQTAIAAGDAEKVAKYELEKIGSPDRPGWLEKVGSVEDSYYERGLTHGARLSLRISANICQVAAKQAPDQKARASLLNSLAIALRVLGERGDDAALARSVTAFEAALEVRTRETSPMDWAMTQNNLANALLTLGERGDEAALARSVTAFEAALEVRTREASPMDWAMTQNNLANALLTLGERGDDAALARSVTAFEAALEVYTREDSPMDWAMTQNNLGNALLTLGERGDDAALARSVTAFEAALEVRTRETSPMQWAMTQNNLGNALLTLGKRGDEAALARSVTAFEAALEVRTREASPMDWAMTQNNLANALLTLGERGDDAALARSVTAFEAALEVYTREDSPMDWAMTQNNLGNALLTLGERGDDAALARSVTAFEAALEVRTRETSPMQWAMTQNNLGNALQTLGKRGDEAALARSVTAYEAALEVYTREASPMQWAITRENMGNLFLFRAGKGESKEIHSAIDAFEDALSVFSLEHHPFNFEKASRSLAEAQAIRDGLPAKE